jgi:hypothetical protein
VFSGTEKDETRRQEQYETWKSQLYIKLALDGEAFPGEWAKVLYACQHLSHTAFAHVRDVADSVAQHKYNPDAWKGGVRQFEDLIKLLDPVYLTQDAKAASRRKFQALKQNNKKFGDFISEFIRLSDVCGYPDFLRVESLRQKVCTELDRAVMYQVNRPSDVDFNGWVKLYRNLANNIADVTARPPPGPATPV